jgi:DNA-directed RNA polymerase subunit E'/Rpb7
MDKIFRFNNYGYIEVKAKTEAEARELIKGCVTAMDSRGIFVCVSPTEVMDILDLEYNSLKYPAVK